MKKLKTALIACTCLTAVNAMGQSAKTTIKSGTPIELEALKTTYAREVEIGDKLNFKVIADVKQDGMVIIPVGTMATGVVTEAKKSSIAGTKGRLSIDFKNLTLDNGEQVPLSGNARISGKNRTPLAVITGLFVWPCIFIPGTKAVMPEGYNATATVLTNTEITK